MATLKRDGIRGHYWFIEKNGKVSESFYQAEDYKNGFAQIRKSKKSPLQWRDLLGRTTDEPTRSGVAFNHFCEGIVSLSDLEVIHFADEIFCQGIKDEIVRQLKERLKSEFIAGVIINKTRYQEKVDKSFRYIDNAHIEALKIIKNRKREEEERRLAAQREDEERRLAAQREERERENAERARQNAFDDTFQYLESL